MRSFLKLGLAVTLTILLNLYSLSLAFAVDIIQVTSPGGIKAWLIEDRTNPIISMKFTFAGGSSVDPVGKEGLANLVAATIDEGAGDYDSQAFQARLNDLSISLGFDAGREFFSGELVTLKKNKEAAFELLNLSLTEPRFDQEPIERIRTQISLVLKQRQDDPGYKAQRTLRNLYYPNHVYGRANDGTPESLKKITTSELKGYLAENIAQNNLTVAVVGDIDRAELGTLLDQAFSGLSKKSKPFRIPGASPAIKGGTIILDEDIPQSEVLMAHKGISRDDPDYYAAFIVNHIFGGGSFSSRLYQEVREKRGLTYSVGSYLSLLDQAPLLMASVATQNERVAETIRIMKEQWSLMAEEGPSAQELKDAKTYLTGSFPLSFTSTGRVANILLAMQLNDLGIDYLDQRNEYLETVSLEDAKRVARELFKPDEITVVIAGRPVGVEAETPLSGNP